MSDGVSGLTIMLIACGCIPFPDTCRSPTVGAESKKGRGVLDQPTGPKASQVPGEAAGVVLR